ncbi:MAG TPA: autotransporter domain-containing protein [Oleiagrimonas sp.]|nr:autotransporter domain-containing protein [Oleiagrimonas sp.]
MLRLRHLSVALITALAASTAAHAGTTDFNQMVVIGDSLSDNGNISLATGASQPSRFTTNPGEVAVEHVADHFGFNLTPSVTGGNDYAFGGARVKVAAGGGTIPSLTTQWASYLANNGGQADAHTLYSVWGGANDIFYHVKAVGAAATAQQLIEQTIQQQVQAALTGGVIQPGQVNAFIQQITPTVTQQVLAQVAAVAGVTPETPAQAQAGIAMAAKQELALLGQIHASGAEYTLVFNLPDIGKTPAAAAQGAVAQQSLAQLSLLYNGVLAGGLNQLSDQGLNIVPVDVYALFNEVIANPSAFGFSNVTAPACGVGSTSVKCGPQGSGAPYTYAPGTDKSYLFADGVHPTTAAHKMLGQYVIAELSAPGQVSMLAEAPLAATHAHMNIIREQMRIDQAGGNTRAFAGISYGKQSIDATANAPGVDSKNVNLTIGVDAAASEHFHVGAALGLARNNADIGSGGYRMDSIIGSGYAMWHSGGGYIGANVGFAQLSYNDINRRFQLGQLTRTETGQTSGSQLMAGLNGGWWFGSESFRTGPFARVQWQRVRVDGYSEAGDDSSAMWFGGQERVAMVGTLGWQFKGNWQAGGSTLHPYLSVAWNHDSRADARKVRAGLSGMPGSFALTGFLADADWASADLGLAADFSDSVSGWIAYRGRFADSNQRVNSLDLGMKFVF